MIELIKMLNGSFIWQLSDFEDAYVDGVDDQIRAIRLGLV